MISDGKVLSDWVCRVQCAQHESVLNFQRVLTDAY